MKKDVVLDAPYRFIIELWGKKSTCNECLLTREDEGGSTPLQRQLTQIQYNKAIHASTSESMLRNPLREEML